MTGFKKTIEPRYTKVALPPLLDQAAAQEFAAQSKAWMMGDATQFVLDFEGVTLISREFYRSMIEFERTLRKDHKTIASVNMESRLYKQIVADGLDQVFKSVKSIQELSPKEKPSSSHVSLNVAFINPFLSATQKTLEVQCNTKVTVLKPHIKKSQLENVRIASVLTLISNTFSGSVVLCFPEPVFLKIYENMFGETAKEITPEIQDAAGELLNIIYGLAKIELNPAGYDFKKALPTVLAGDQIRVRQPGLKPTVVVPFSIDEGIFHLEIEFDTTLEDKNV